MRLLKVFFHRGLNRNKSVLNSIKITFMHGASLYTPYSLLLLSINSGWGGGGWEGGESVGGEARGPSWRGRIRGVEGENKRGGAGWLSSLIHLSGPSRVN